MAFEVKTIHGIKDTNVEWDFLRPVSEERDTDNVAEEIKSFYEYVSKLGGAVVGSHVMVVTKVIPNSSNILRSDLYIVANVPDSIEA